MRIKKSDSKKKKSEGLSAFVFCPNFDQSIVDGARYAIIFDCRRGGDVSSGGPQFSGKHRLHEADSRSHLFRFVDWSFSPTIAALNGP